jgi:two-component system, chemotaxis family, chemotaxis protein CheY
MTVLIVDDEPDIRETLRDAFQDEGYHVVVAGNGVEALAKLEHLRSFHRELLVVLDLVMPRMSGNEVLAAMQADPRLASVPVIVVTSDPSQAPDGVLTIRKPLRLKLLIDTVAKVGGRP